MMHRLSLYRTLRRAALYILTLGLVSRALTADAVDTSDPTVSFVAIVHRVVVDSYPHRDTGAIQTILENVATGQSYFVSDPKRIVSDLPPGTLISIEGQIRERTLQLAAAHRARYPMVAKSHGRNSPVVGTRRTAVIMIESPAIRLPVDCTPSRVAGMLSSDVDAVTSFFHEASFGQLQFVVDSNGDGAADVFGPYSLAYDLASLDIYALANQADSLAAAAGVDLSVYEHRIYFIAEGPGLGELGCVEFCRSWVGTFPSDFTGSCAPLTIVFAHELGHNLGLCHASTPGVEYGDVSDVMGAANHCCTNPSFPHLFYPHPNAPHKDMLGWFNNSVGRVVDAPSGGGRGQETITLTALELPSEEAGPVQVVRFGKDLYASIRARIGFDAEVDVGFPPGQGFGNYIGKTSVHRARVPTDGQCIDTGA